jgi:hypothetical protein
VLLEADASHGMAAHRISLALGDKEKRERGKSILSNPRIFILQFALAHCCKEYRCVLTELGVP